MSTSLQQPGPFSTALALFLTLLFVLSTANTASGQTTAFEVVKTSDSSSLLKILDDGKVGVGTATPSARLQVVHSTDDDAAIQMSNLNTGVSAAALLIARSDANNLLYLGAASAAHNGTWGTLRAQRTFVWADGTGSLGLDLVANKSNGDIRMYTGGNAAGNERLRILSTGNVGIGTTSPGQLLTVAGTVESTTGGFKFPDGTTQTTAATGGSSLWTQTGSDIFYTSGNVGIGTASPSTTLELVTTAQSSTAETLFKAQVSDNSTASISLFNNATGDGIFSPSLKGLTSQSGINALGLVGDVENVDTGLEAAVVIQGQAGAGPTTSRDVLRIRNYATDLVTVDKDGNVGIGTTSPSAKLDVVGTTELNGNVSINSNFTVDTNTLFVDGANDRVGIGTTSPSSPVEVFKSGATPTLRIKKGDAGGEVDLIFDHNGTQLINYYDGSKLSWFKSPDDLVVIENSGNVGIGTSSPSARLQAVAANNSDIGLIISGASGSHSGDLLRIEESNGGNRRVTVTTLGNVGIGNSVTNPGNILTVEQGSTTDPIADAWTQYSSRRWKTNIQTLDGALNKIQRLRGVSYQWKADGQPDIGLIAEEVGEVIPEVVAYEDNGIDARSVDYSRLVALLIEAVKEQQQTIEAQQITMNDMAEKIAAIEAALKQLKKADLTVNTPPER